MVFLFASNILCKRVFLGIYLGISWIIIVIVIVSPLQNSLENRKEPQQSMDQSDHNELDRKYGMKHVHLKIPYILHQTWKTRNVPRVTYNWIRSWTDLNPDLEHWFWSDEATEALMLRQFYFYYGLYKWYPWSIQRADAMRYFVLFEFGGIYADIDVECLKPLDQLVLNHACVLAKEPDIISYIHHGRNRSLSSNALMACRPRHPFMKLVIENLFSRIERNGLLETTGPFMLDDIVQTYTAGMANLRKEDELLVLPDDYCISTNKVAIKSGVIAKCQQLIKKSAGVSVKQKLLCDEVLSERHKKDNVDVDSNRAYVVHHLLHTYNFKNYTNLDQRDQFDIFNEMTAVKDPFEQLIKIPSYVKFRSKQ